MDPPHNSRRTPNLPIPEGSNANPLSSKRAFNRSSTPSSISKGRSRTRKRSDRHHTASRPNDSRRMDSRRVESSDLDQGGPILVFDSNSRPTDSDLMDVLARLEGHEQRICLIIGNMHNEMTKCTNYMLECVSLHLKKVVETEKKKIPTIEKLRETQRAANAHLQELQSSTR